MSDETRFGPSRGYRRGVAAGVLALSTAFAGCDPLGLGSLLNDRPEGASVLTLLDTDGRQVDVGDEVTGALSTGDYVSVNGAYLEAWAFDGEAGQEVSIDLVSDDFDAYLYVVGPGIDGALSDDDGGGACHARVDFTVLEAGRFHVVASTNGSNRSGPYRLQVNAEPDAVEPISCGGAPGAALSALPDEGRVLRRSEPGVGRLHGSEPSLENGRPVQAWRLEGRAGESVVVTMRSDDFDAYLYAAGPGLVEALTDDDGAGDLDAELTVTFPETGRYTVGAAALHAGSTGAYTLVLSEPVELAALGTDGRALAFGIEADGILSNADPVVEDRRVQAWAYSAEAGQRVTIDLMSEAFDAYLQVAGPGFPAPRADDDGGEGLNSRMDVTFPQRGTYRIIAGSLGGDGGAFTLRVW